MDSYENLLYDMHMEVELCVIKTLHLILTSLAECVAKNVEFLFQTVVFLLYIIRKLHWAEL